MRDKISSSPVLSVVSKILFAPIIIFGLYVQFHGDYGPGGGFQAGVIVAAAFLLVYTSDSLSVKMNWEHGFVGTQFLALCTSLPELAASIAAIRLSLIHI